MLKEVKKYIEKQNPVQAGILKKIRGVIVWSAPLAEERMSYGVPAFRLRGGLVLYAGFKEHIGFYPEPKTIESFAKELKGYKTSKGAIKFPLGEPIPYDLIEKIVINPPIKFAPIFSKISSENREN